MTAAASVPGKELEDNHRAALRSALGDAVRFNEPLAPKTSMRIGGPAAAYVSVSTPALLAQVLQICESEGLAWTVLGRGSNVVVRDAGFPGVVIHLTGEFTKISVEGETIRAGGAVPIVAVCREAARAGLEGAEELAGIPGSVGGAIRMNAGTRVEIGDLVRRVGILIPGHPGLDILPQFAYRTSSLDRRAVVCFADLVLRRGDRQAVQARVREHLARRNATQPLSLPNAGSIFRNPPGDFAARLIEAAGCKGMRCGGAEVSPKHANFIVNRGGATCADVLSLIDRVRDAVRQRHGVELELEIQIL